MNQLHFPKPFEHKHPPIRNVQQAFEEQLTVGQRASDRLTLGLGSWRFILIQLALLIAWVVVNASFASVRWDPYPFILMNLFLSMQAAFTAPIIMMSQNRQAAHDRVEAHNDYLINQKAEDEIGHMLEHLAAQDRALAVLHEALQELLARSENKD